MSFDVALTAAGSEEPAIVGTEADDDRFVVLATTDDSVWTPLAKWGSDTERDDIRQFGQPGVDLTGDGGRE